MSRVLVIGGNGFVGRHVVAALRDRGDSVRVLALEGEDTGWLAHVGVDVRRGDVRHRDDLSGPMRDVDGVLNLAAMMDVWRPIKDYHAVNVTGARNVGRVALDQGVRRLVHMSSSSVYGIGLRRPADESFPLAPFRDPYPLTKAAGDRAVQQMIAEERLPAVIIRPDQIFGPGDRLHFARMADRLRANRSVIVGTGDNALPFVYVTDVVAGLLLALDHERAVGQAYNITTDRPLTQRQLLEAIAEEVGARPPRLQVPYRALYAGGYLAERAAALSGSSRRPAITRLGAAFFGEDARFAIGKARWELGFSPQVDLREGVRLAAQWYRREARPGPSRPVGTARAAEGVRT